MNSFDANKVLPTNVSLKSVDNHLFRIGLSFNHYTNDESLKKRHFLYNPILINSILLIQLIKSIVNLIVLDPMLVIWSGDFARALGIRIHVNILLILVTSVNLSSSLIWYYNYIKGNDTKHLRLFQVMSGQISPNHLGIYDKQQILPLIKKTRIFLKMTVFNSWIFLAFGSVLTLGTMTEATLWEYLLFGIANTLHFGSFDYHTTNLALNQCFYFHITCVYLRNKIKRFNDMLLKNKISIHSTFKSIDSLYKEIDGYNRLFWSKYLLTFWVFWGSIEIVLLYCGLFQPMLLFFKITFLYVFIVNLLFFLFVVLSASSVNFEAKKSHKLLNSLYVSYYSNQRIRIRGKRINLRELLMQLKV